MTLRPLTGTVLALLLLASVLTGCTTQVEPPASPALQVIVGAPAATLNPYSPMLSARQVGELVFRGLTDVDAEGRVVADLASEVPTKANGGISEDGLTITYHLDTEARWHDGDALTSADVLFTAQLLADGIIEDEPAAEKGRVVSVEAPDPSTVVVHLAEPLSALAWRWMPYVLPEHLLVDSQDLLSDPFWIRPVGSGLFEVVESQHRTSVILRAADGTTPDLHVLFVGDDDTARTLWDGAEAAVWLDPPVGAVTPEETYDATATSVWRALYFNFAADHATADPEVREALAAVTRLPAPAPSSAEITPTAQVTPAGEAEPAPGTDAGTTLSRAGWRPGSEGVRARAGKALVARLIVPVLEQAEGETFLGLQTLWQELGAQADVVIAGPEAFANGHASGGALWTGDYELARYDLPIDLRYGWGWPFDSSDMPATGNPFGLNVSRVSDARLDALYAQMRHARTPEELEALTAAAWDRAVEIDVAIWEGPLPASVLFKGVVGVRASAQPLRALSEASQWRLSSGTTE